MNEMTRQTTPAPQVIACRIIPQAENTVIASDLSHMLRTTLPIDTAAQDGAIMAISQTVSLSSVITSLPMKDGMRRSEVKDVQPTPHVNYAVRHQDRLTRLPYASLTQDQNQRIMPVLPLVLDNVGMRNHILTHIEGMGIITTPGNGNQTTQYRDFVDVFYTAHGVLLVREDLNMLPPRAKPRDVARHMLFLSLPSGSHHAALEAREGISVFLSFFAGCVNATRRKTEQLRIVPDLAP